MNRKERDRKYGIKLRAEAIRALGGKCARCGVKDYRVLQIDHIDGGGRAEQAKITNRGIYRKIRDGHTDGYQVLCANCNWIKKYENNEWPYMEG
jgi:hypothetical protein